MKKIQYQHKVDIGDGWRQPRFTTVNVDDRFVKVYDGVIATLLSLPDCAANLITYLSHKMSEDNIVHHNKFTRENFNKFIYKVWYDHYKSEGLEDPHVEAKLKTYKDNTVKKAFSTLADRGLLIPKTRGMFVVNPEFYFKKSDRARLEKIKVVLEMQSGVRDVNMQIIGE